MALAARLYLRTKEAAFRTWALKEYNWFFGTGLIATTAPQGKDPGDPGASNLVYDGLDSKGKPDPTSAFWTYNCGVILHALCDLSIITGDVTLYRGQAERIADAAISYFSDATGVLTERNPDVSSIDHCMFKGVFIRNLAALFAYYRPQDATDHSARYNTFITKNATSVLAYGTASQFGAHWDSPPDSFDFVRQTAAINAINAANSAVIATSSISLTKTLAQAGLKPSGALRGVISWLTPSVRAWTTVVTT